jgi:hypothetical protein
MQRLSWIFDSNKLRIKLQIEARIRDRSLFNLATIDLVPRVVARASMSRAARHRSLQAKAQRRPKFAARTHR